MKSEVASKAWTKSLLSKSFDYMKNDLTPFNNYSEDEIIIGCWTNGKPVYRKICFVQSNQLSGTTTTNIPHNITDIDTIVDCYGLSCYGADYVRLPFAYATGTSSSAAYYGMVRANDTNMVFQLGSNFYNGINNSTEKQVKVYIEYTKKTDAENSFKPEMLTGAEVEYFADSFNIFPNEYSEEEIIVGCWTDGKPIYRKVFQGTTPGNTTNTTTSVRICSVLDNLVSFDYIMKDSSNFLFTGAANVGNGEIYSAWLTDLYYIRHRASGSAFFNRPVIWIAEYTKTTDAPNSYTIDMILDQYNIPRLKSIDTKATEDEVEEVLGE